MLNCAAAEVDTHTGLPPEGSYLPVASMWEAGAGVGCDDAGAEWDRKARAIQPCPRMPESTEGQIASIV